MIDPDPAVASYRRRERRIVIGGLVVVALLCAGWYAWCKEPCVFNVLRHERHTTAAQKRAVFLRAGIPYDKAHRKLYVVDHLIPLELGGLDDVSNMQLQEKEAGRQKDIIENFLARCVCVGDTPLPEAQELVKTWMSVDPMGTCPK